MVVGEADEGDGRGSEAVMAVIFYCTVFRCYFLLYHNTFRSCKTHA
jgi:hypothetical protein